VLRVKLAERLSVALDDQPELKLPGSRPPQMLASLLTLCAEVYRPEALWKPLLRMKARRKLAAEWPQGVPLKDLLRSALMLNQDDNAMEAEWLAMIDGSNDGFLSGDIYDGLRGISLMKLKRGSEPRWDVLAPALRKIAYSLNGSGDGRNLEFRAILDGLRQLYHLSGWNELFLMAVEYDWPAWTITAFCPPAARDNGHVYVLSSMAAALNQYGGEKQDELWGGLVWKISIKSNEDANALFHDFVRDSRAAVEEMKEPSVKVWVEAMGNAIVYVHHDSSKPQRIAALNTALKRLRNIDIPMIESKS
jgi:hypothetical protein